MPEVSKATLKTYFQDGKEPDENKFIDLIDTMALVSGVPGDFIVGGEIYAIGAIVANTDAVASGAMSIRGAAGGYKQLHFQTGTFHRWSVTADGGAESGSNVGSDFVIYRYTDGGGYLGSPFTIKRSTGDVTLQKDQRIGGGLVVGNNAYNPAVGNIWATKSIIANIDGTGQGDLDIRKGAGYYGFLNFKTGGSLRWRVSADNAAESGSHAGSHFAIFRYGDSDEYLGLPLHINRQDGRVTLEGQLAVGGDLDTGGGLRTKAWSLHGSAGVGLELGYSSPYGIVSAYDRSAGEYKSLKLEGEIVQIYDGDTWHYFVDSDFYTVPWTDYSSLSDIVGWASYTVKQIFYKKVGKLVFVTFRIVGASNSTAVTFSLPFTNGGGVNVYNTHLGIDTAGSRATYGSLTAGSNIYIVYGTIAAGNWATSGNKFALGQFWYEVP
jgi:hypothetical protein